MVLMTRPVKLAAQTGTPGTRTSSSCPLKRYGSAERLEDQLNSNLKVRSVILIQYPFFVKFSEWLCLFSVCGQKTKLWCSYTVLAL